jgi:transcription elongation factor Elf1
VPDAQRQNTTRSTPIRNWAALSHWKRKRKMEARLDEPRVWMLECDECEHLGSVHISLRRLRAANLVCSECGAVLRKRSKAQ